MCVGCWSLAEENDAAGFRIVLENRYLIDVPPGGGGTGVVHRGRDDRLHQDVVIGEKPWYCDQVDSNILPSYAATACPPNRGGVNAYLHSWRESRRPREDSVVRSILGLRLMTIAILVAVFLNACGVGRDGGTGNSEDGGNGATPQTLPTSPATEAGLDQEDSGDGATANPHPTSPATEAGLDGEDSGGVNGGEILLVTPYVSESDMASINEAFSSGESSPWGFEHRGIDFFPSGNLKPFQAVCSGAVDAVDLWQLDTTSNWQVSVRIICNSTYSAIYAFEPMTAVQPDGETQLANLVVSEGQSVAQRDLIGYLLSTGEASHVDFGFYANRDAICPEPYFTREARDSIVGLIRITWPDARMCYH